MSKITCEERGPNLGPKNDTTLDYYEITADGKVWPCCIYISLHLKVSDEDQPVYKEVLYKDAMFKELTDKDENWNSLYHHNLEEITQNKFFTDHNNKTGWESDNPPFVCNLFCSENARGIKGYSEKKI